ncbi:hypothetical protein IIC38_04405 [candidate division KSB1 bacterium]|nr:hypothetical protein [candidate division KSB1 bacterium]
MTTCSCDFDGTGSQAVNSDALKYGVVYNDCGPTDSPVVRIILTDEEFSCKDNHRNVNHIVSYLEIGTVKEIKIGMVISGHASSIGGEPDSGYECEKDFKNCVEIGVISIEILGSDRERLEGTWKFEGSDRTGNFNVEKCDQKSGACG